MKLIKSERSIQNMSKTKNTNKTDRLDIRCRPEIKNLATEPLPAKAGMFGLLLKQPKVVPLLLYSFILYFYPISKLSDLLLSCKS